MRMNDDASVILCDPIFNYDKRSKLSFYLHTSPSYPLHPYHPFGAPYVADDQKRGWSLPYSSYHDDHVAGAGSGPYGPLFYKKERKYYLL